MLMASSVVIIAFVVIFATTYTREWNDNRDKLLFALPVQHMTTSGATIIQESRGGMESGRTGMGFAEAPESARRFSPNAGLSFSIFVDLDNEIVDINSMLDLEYETYALMAAKAMEAADSTKAINVDGRMWQYKVSPITVYSGESFFGIPPFIFTAYELNHIRFLDVTDSYRSIRSLALMLSGLLIVTLALFFIISRYFANRAIKPMEEAWEKQTRFITDASHELKTPLSVINANCGVLYTGKEETVGSQLKWVDSIMRAADRMAGLVSGMMSLVSLEDNHLKLQKSLFDLSEAVADATVEIEAPSLEKGLRITRDIEPGIEIESDKEHVAKILSVLLDNAVKYTDSGGEVSVSLLRENRGIICAVRNSGAGIPPEDLPHVFDRFYRGDPARSSAISGYGLGLSIAKAIANQLGAKLTADSELDEYTEFRFSFEA